MSHLRAVVKKQNLRVHYEKVTRKSIFLLPDKLIATQPKRRRSRRWRKLLFYGLLSTCIILISTVAALVISETLFVPISSHSSQF